MAVVGRASVLVAPSFKGFQKAVKGEVQSSGEQAGSRFGGRFSAGFKRVAKGGVVAGAALVGAALAKGFGRLKAIEEAQAKLRGLGHDANSVDAIMQNALASVKGTAFGLGEAATTAASLVAAGVEPGKDLERTLKSVANGASAAGIGMDEMGSIFGKVFSSGKAQNDSLQQVADRGIPIYQALADMLGVTTDEVFKMASAGEISAAQFEAAMTKASGTVAKEMGTTFTGRLSNAWAALGRIGANLLSGVFPKMGGALGKITDALGPMEDKAAAVGKALGGWLATAARWVADSVGWLSDKISTFAAIAMPHLKDFAARMGEAFRAARPLVIAIGRTLVAAFRALKPYLIAAAAVLGGALYAAMKVLPPVLTATFKALTWLHDTLRPLLPALAAGAAGFLAIKGAIAAVGLAKAAINMVKFAKAVTLFNAKAAIWYARTVAVGIAQKAVAVGTKIWAAAQWLLNAAMSANPIGLVIAGLVALGAGLVLAYKKSETFRRIVNGAWAGIKKVVSVVVNWFTGTALPLMKRVFAAIGNAAKWLWSKAIKPAVAAIKRSWINLSTSVQRVWRGFLKPVFELFGAIVKRLYQMFIRPYITGIRNLWSAMGTAIRAVYHRYLKPVVDAFKRIVGAMRTYIAAQVGWVKTYWSGMGTALRSVYNRHLKPVVDALKSKIKTVKDAFETAVDGVKKQWGKLEGVAKKPIRFVVNTVINKGLIAAFNKLAGTFGTSKMSEVSLPRGFERGGWTGPGRANKAAGVVHADEFVISKRARRSIEAKHPGLLDHMLLYGDVPGYKKGGRVWPLKGSKAWTTYAGHTGIDFPRGMGTPVFATEAGTIAKAAKLGYSYGWHYFLKGKSGITTIYAHLSKMIAKAGQAVTAGAQIGNVGSSGNSTGPHLHFETRPGGTPGAAAGYLGGAGAPKGGIVSSAISKLMGAFTSVKDWLVSKFKSPLDKLKDITDSPFGRLAAGLPRKVKNSLIDYAVDKIPFDSGGMLMPGYTLAYNGTRRAEPVFTGSQWDKLDALLAGSGKQEIRGELVLRNGKAYIEGVVADVARDAGLVRS